MNFFDECMCMSDGKKVRVKRDSESKLPLVELREVEKQEMREIVNKRKQTTNEQHQVAALLRQEQDASDPYGVHVDTLAAHVH